MFHEKHFKNIFFWKNISKIFLFFMYNLCFDVPLSSSSSVVELSVDSLTSDLPLLAMDRAEKLTNKINE